MPQPIGANEAKCIAERKITAKVIAPATAKGEWSSFTRGNTRSVLLRSRTIPQQLKCTIWCSSYRGPHTAEVQLVTVHRLSYMILSPKVERVLATSTGLGPLRKSRLRSRPRRPRVVECQRVRGSRIHSSEGLCTDAELEAVRYVR